MARDYEKEGLPQIDAMRHGVDYKFTVRCRGFTVDLRVLTLAESTEIISSVLKYMHKLPQQAQTPAKEREAHVRETLKLASTSEMGVFDPQITDPMLDHMSLGEVDFLFKQYIIETDRVNPVLETMPDEDLRLLVDGIKKKDKPLIELSFSELVNVCRFLTRGD